MWRRCCFRIVTVLFTVIIGESSAWSQQSPSSHDRTTVAAPPASQRPYLGMRAESAGTPAARQLGIESPYGAVVLSTVVAGPSDAAGLRRGDLIVQFAGKEVTNFDELATALAGCPIGSSQTVDYVRDMDRKTTRVVIGGWSPEGVPPPQPPPAPSNTPPTSSVPPAPPAESPTAPAGWVERQAGNLLVYLPPDWTAVPFLASDEGCWFRGTMDAKQAVFAVVRDVSKEELLAPMTVRREEPLTLAGQSAAGYIGPTVEQELSGQGLVVYPTEREAGHARWAVLCFASGEHWAEYESTFRTILQCVRNRDAAR